VTVVWLSAWALFTVDTASAQDSDHAEILGYKILGEDTAGPYNIQVQVSPPLPIVGISRFAVRVTDIATGQNVDDAMVRIFGSPAIQGKRQYSPALNSPFDQTFYLAQLDLEEEGVWAVDVEVESELGEGATVLQLQVQPRARNGTGSGWGTALFTLVTLTFLAGFGWLWYSSKKARARRAQSS